MSENIITLEHSGEFNGAVTLRDPLGGAVRKAMEKAEISGGNIKVTSLVGELIPYCIQAHPWGAMKVSEAVDRLNYQDWMKLFNGVKDRLQPVSSDDLGESDQPSSETDSPAVQD